MRAVVVVCVAFSLIVSEANTEIVCKTGMPGATAILSIEAAGQVSSQTKDFVYLGGDVNHNVNLYNEVDRRICNP